MNYNTNITIPQEKIKLFQHLMNNNNTKEYDAIELTTPILDVTFENQHRMIFSFAGVETDDSKNDVWIEAKLVDKNNTTLAILAPQINLYDTFYIEHEGDTYTVDIRKENK